MDFNHNIVWVLENSAGETILAETISDKDGVYLEPIQDDFGLLQEMPETRSVSDIKDALYRRGYKVLRVMDNVEFDEMVEETLERR
jgi:hypothetical protein